MFDRHIDNPKDYADNADATQFDRRLRGPVSQAELAVDHNTGMKNYIANESGGWATSLGYIKYSFARSIHFGRLYTHGAQSGREEDLCEALRCLGQGLHCVEDFGAHTNYTELALRELGYHSVFAHVGAQTMMNLHGKQVFPLVTGTFGGVDFLHSVLGEATDHITQTEVNQAEVDQLDAALTHAQAAQNSGKRSAGDDPADRASGFTSLLAQVPGTNGLIQEAVQLQAASDAQQAENERNAGGASYDSSYAPYGNQYDTARASNPPAQQFQAPPGSQGGPPKPGIPGVNMNVDPQAAMAKIYPLLAFRDKVVRTISGIVSKIPGLEKAIETISEKVTLFIMGLLAPFIKPIIAAASNALKQGSGTVVDASAKQQYLVWTDPTSTDPTHSMLSKDHFSNILNAPSGQLAAATLKYVAPRVIYGWDHPEVPEQEILQDVGRVFHHPALRDHNLEIHREMFAVVERWARARPQGAKDLNTILSSESVRAGRNHTVADMQSSMTGLESKLQSFGAPGGGHGHGTGGGPLGAFLGGGSGGRRDIDDFEDSNLAYGEDSYGQASYGQAQQQQAGYEPENTGAYPTAYQQGYEEPFNPAQQRLYDSGQQPQQQQGYDDEYGQQQQQQGQYQQGGYGGYQGQGQGQGHGGGYGTY